MDFIFASFVQKAEDVRFIRKVRWFSIALLCRLLHSVGAERACSGRAFCLVTRLVVGRLAFPVGQPSVVSARTCPLQPLQPVQPS
jgi:hypothetical protein